MKQRQQVGWRWTRPWTTCIPIFSLVATIMTALALSLISSRPYHSSDCPSDSPRQLFEASIRVVDTQEIGPPLANSLLAHESSSWQNPLYSSHTCITQKFDDSWQKATCKFENVCLNSSTLKFEYYVDPDYNAGPLTYDQAGNPFHDFPETLVHPSHWMEDKDSRWSPQVVRRKFPQPGPRVKWGPTPQALLQAFPIRFVYNFGHAIFDVLVPLFHMQQLFGIYTPDAQVVILWAQGGDKKKLRNRMHATFNPWHPELNLLRLTWDRDATFLKNVTLDALGDREDGLVCFRTVLAGTGYLSRRMSNLDALPYRQAVVARLGVVETPHLVPVITVLNKKGRRVIENTPEVVDILRARYPAALIQVQDFDGTPDLTPADQVKLMSETSILLSPCGGVATVLMFMQPQTTAIVMNYWHTLRGRSVNMEDQYYRHLNYLDIQYFPVTLQEYEGTGDRPGCELQEEGGGWEDGQDKGRYKKSGALANCNLRIQGSGMERLVHYVDAAMLRWAAKTGQYQAVASIRRAGAFHHPTASEHSTAR